MVLQILTLKHLSNHQQRCYQINDKKVHEYSRSSVHTEFQNTTKLVPPAHSHYTLSRELQTVYIIVYITSDLIYSRTKIVIVLASEKCFAFYQKKLLDWYCTNTMSQLKPKMMHSDFICSRFYVRYSDCCPDLIKPDSPVRIFLV